MTVRLKLLCLAMFCWAANPVEKAFPASPYAAISERNVFHLRPPPAFRPELKQAPLPRVHLTGITTILRGKRALLKVDFPAKPPERPKQESYILTEGQRAGTIEVLEIDEKAAQVKVDNSGVVTNITFEKLPVVLQCLCQDRPCPRFTRAGGLCHTAQCPPERQHCCRL